MKTWHCFPSSSLNLLLLFSCNRSRHCGQMNSSIKEHKPSLLRDCWWLFIVYWIAKDSREAHLRRSLIYLPTPASHCSLNIFPSPTNASLLLLILLSSPDFPMKVSPHLWNSTPPSKTRLRSSLSHEASLIPSPISVSSDPSTLVYRTCTWKTALRILRQYLVSSLSHKF